MNYDLNTKEERLSFIKRVNSLLKNRRSNVALVDESNRTLNQNAYIHILCRIMASQTGVTEEYAKQVYFKDLANPGLFSLVSKDSLTGKMIKYNRSTKDLSVPEMRKAIYNFRAWASENGFYLPDAHIEDDGSMTFASDQDRSAYHQAVIQTSKMEQYL